MGTSSSQGVAESGGGSWEAEAAVVGGYVGEKVGKQQRSGGGTQEHGARAGVLGLVGNQGRAAGVQSLGTGST